MKIKISQIARQNETDSNAISKQTPEPDVPVNLFIFYLVFVIRC